MLDTTLSENEQPSGPPFYVSTLLDKMEKLIQDHRQKDPDLYRIIEEKKLLAAAKEKVTLEKKIIVTDPCDLKQIEPLYFKQYQQRQLKQKIAANQAIIHEKLFSTQAMIAPRTKASNAKQAYVDVEAMKTDREKNYLNK